MISFDMHEAKIKKVFVCPLPTDPRNLACLKKFYRRFRWHFFLAHLSRRLTRWAYSIPMVRCPSVVVCCPHFKTWISLKPGGQSWWNYMCSITGVGERLHTVLLQIGSKLWFPWKQKAPIDLQWGKRCLHLFLVVFDPILFILAGNEDMHKILDEVEFRPDRTTDYGVSCPWASKTFS